MNFSLYLDMDYKSYQPRLYRRQICPEIIMQFQPDY